MIYDINGNPLQTVYGLNGSALSHAYDFDGEQIFPDSPVPIEWLDTAVVSALPSISVNGTKQGGCTDGTYIYQTCGDSSAYTYMDIIKYKISDGTYTTKRFSGTPNFGHANDMTYNPNNNRLYVPTMLDDGTVIVLDADDLSYVETLIIKNGVGNPFPCWQLCFNRLTNEFVCPINYRLFFYNQNMEFLRAVDAESQPEATAQNADTDGYFIYRLTYNPSYVFICSLDGEFVKTVTLPGTGEPESIMYNWTNGEYYLSRNVNSGIFSKVQLKAQ